PSPAACALGLTLSRPHERLDAGHPRLARGDHPAGGDLDPAGHHGRSGNRRRPARIHRHGSAGARAAAPADQAGGRRQIRRSSLIDRRRHPFLDETRGGAVGWRALLRVVDFQSLLSSQPLIASALEKAQHTGGPKSPEARALRESYYLLAKVLWTRRASIRRIHDLAWLDHTVVSAGAPPGRGWED